jgi:hypothetical protein
MIVDDLDVVGVTVFPPETDPPLFIDPDVVLSLSVPGKLFESVSWGNAHIIQRLGGVQQQELPQCHPTQGVIKLRLAFPEEDAFCLLVSKASDHLSEHGARR